jgi:hypothetical protein
MAFKIIEKKYDWAYPPQKRVGKPRGIVEHHAAATHCTPDDVHRWHLGNDWSGIGYHAFIAKDGKIYRGRPINTLGAHCLGATQWLGIVYEGNFEREKMPLAQKRAGRWLTRRWKKAFGLTNKQVKGHRTMPLNSTACPGRNFPMAYIKS